MHLTCQRSALLEALSIVRSVVPRKEIKPILEGIKFTATKGEGLQLEATDLEMSVQYRVEAEVSKPGATVVPGQLIASFIRDLEGDEVEIKSSKSLCGFRSGTDHTNLTCMDAKDFPELMSAAGETEMTLPMDTFKEMLSKTGFAAAKEAGRYSMHGMLLDFSSEDQLRAVTTDGRRLAMTTREVGDHNWSASTSTSLKPVISPKALKVITKVPSETLEILNADTGLAFNAGPAKFLIRGIDGQYPRYEAVIPEQLDNSVMLDRAALISKLKLIANLCSEEAISVVLEFSEGKLDITSKSLKGQGKGSLEVETSEIEMQIGMNPAYLMEGLTTADDDLVEMQFSGPMEPVVFRLGDKHLYLVMPITVDH